MSKLDEYRRLARLIRGYAVKMTNLEHSGHLGSSLSMAELVAVLYGGILNVDPRDPGRADRDRLILSKGHAAAGVYAALAERGFFPKQWTDTYYRDDRYTRAGYHPNYLLDQVMAICRYRGIDTRLERSLVQMAWKNLYAD